MTREENVSYKEDEARTEGRFWWRLVMLWMYARVFADEVPESHIRDSKGNEKLYLNRGLRYIDWMLGRTMIPRVQMEGRSGWTKEFVKEYRRRMMRMVGSVATRRKYVKLPENPNAIIFGIKIKGLIFWLIADTEYEVMERQRDEANRMSNEHLEEQRAKHIRKMDEEDTGEKEYIPISERKNKKYYKRKGYKRKSK